MDSGAGFELMPHQVVRSAEDGTSPSRCGEAHEASIRVIDVMAAQRPSFWLEFGVRLGQALLPLAWLYASKRMPPEEEATWRQAERRDRG